MPDVSRSDSNRSDASRPRVSFNRDVHVKRISGPRTANAYSLSSDGSSFVPTAVRRERPRTRKEMTEEAEAVLKQVDKVSCKASSNVRLEGEERAKPRKKRKESFLKSLTRRSADKAKASSSDVDSSSQEYRVYKVSGSGKKESGKSYDFMSLDRKKLRKEKGNRELEYLSLERSVDGFDRAVLKDKRTTTPLRSSVASIAFDRGKEARPKPKLTCSNADEQAAKKKQPLTPIIESPGIDSADGARESNVDKMIKKLTERGIAKLSKNTGPVAAKAPQSDTCHNDNRPFSYTNGFADGAITESLGEDLKSTSPTSDVIYAQVYVGGREGSVQKTTTTTVHSRVASNEAGRVAVGDSNRSRAELSESPSRSDELCDAVTPDGDDMWKAATKSGGEARRERQSPQSELYGENPGRRELYRKASSPSPHGDSDHVKTIRVAERQSRSYSKSPSDLRDLSIRREILLSRSESQAKERFNSLKRLQESGATVKRRVSSAGNGVKAPTTTTTTTTTRSDVVRYIGDDTRINDLYATSLRKIPKDVELVQPTRGKRDAKLDASDQSWRGFGKAHAIATVDNRAKVGKSKSFVEEKPRGKRMEKVRMLFKKRLKGSESEEDPLSSRYAEYRGSDLELSDRSADSSPRRSNSNLHYIEDVKKKKKNKKGAAPSASAPKNPMGTLTRLKNNKNKESHWLKPIDKLSNKANTTAKPRSRVDDDDSKATGLRFFGDTDQESTTNDRDLGQLKYKYGLHRGAAADDSDEDPLIIPTRSESRMTDSTLKGSASGARYKSKYDLDRPDYGLKQMSHGLKLDRSKDDYASDTSTIKKVNYDLNGLRYGTTKVGRSATSVSPQSKYGSKEKLRNLKSNPVITVTEPEESLSRRVKSHGNLYNSPDDARRTRRRMYDSSAESTTEGDSSQHSSKSMIYLHAATVGDIPGPRNAYRSERRSQSREELSSVSDGTVLAPNKKKLSRSFSVLAPWRPRHNKEDRVLHYDAGSGLDGKPPAGPLKSKRSLSRERKHNELQFNTLGKENRRRKDLIR